MIPRDLATVFNRAFVRNKLDISIFVYICPESISQVLLNSVKKKGALGQPFDWKGAWPLAPFLKLSLHSKNPTHTLEKQCLEMGESDYSLQDNS